MIVSCRSQAQTKKKQDDSHGVTGKVGASIQPVSLRGANFAPWQSGNNEDKAGDYLLPTVYAKHKRRKSKTTATA